jgi:hypothetical protein
MSHFQSEKRRPCRASEVVAFLGASKSRLPGSRSRARLTGNAIIIDLGLVVDGLNVFFSASRKYLH